MLLTSIWGTLKSNITTFDSASKIRSCHWIHWKKRQSCRSSHKKSCAYKIWTILTNAWTWVHLSKLHQLLILNLIVDYEFFIRYLVRRSIESNSFTSPFRLDYIIIWFKLLMTYTIWYNDYIWFFMTHIYSFINILLFTLLRYINLYSSLINDDSSCSLSLILCWTHSVSLVAQCFH